MSMMNICPFCKFPFLPPSITGVTSQPTQTVYDVACHNCAGELEITVKVVAEPPVGRMFQTNTRKDR